MHFVNLDVASATRIKSRWPPWIILEPKKSARAQQHPPLQRAAAVARHRRLQRLLPTDQSCLGNRRSRRQPGGRSQVAVHLNRLFLSVLDMFRGQSVAFDQSVSTARRAVESFWTELSENPKVLASEWTVSRMAKHCGMCVTTFIRYSRQRRT